MKSQKPTPEITVKLSEELARKLIVICEAEGRTPNNQFLFMLRNNIQYFERTKGKIDAKRLSAVDLSPYYPTQNDDAE